MYIIHQTQPTSTSCFQTCLAMIMGEPVVNIIKKFGGKGVSKKEIHKILDDCRIIYNSLVYPSLQMEGLYIATVPSLNIVGGNHVILVLNDDYGVSTYDPNYKKEGKKFYHEVEGQHLMSYSEVIMVKKGGCLRD